MKKWTILALIACLPLICAAASADAERFCDGIPQGVRELARQYTPDEDYIDCIRFTDSATGDYCLVLSPGTLNGYRFTDGDWKLCTQVNPMRQDDDMRLFFRRHAAGAAPGMQGACGLTYPDGLGFDLIEINPGYHNSVEKMMQFQWEGDHFGLVGLQTDDAGQFAFREDGLWAYFDSETGARLGGARIDRLMEFGLLARFEDLPQTLEEAQKMEAVTQATAETLFPGWTMAHYGEYNFGHAANAAYYRISDGMLCIRRAQLSIAAGGIVSQTDSMPVPLSGALLERLKTEDLDTLLFTGVDSDTFRTADAFDRTKIPVTDTVLQNNL